MASQFENVQFRTYDYDGLKTSLFELATTPTDDRDAFTQWTDTLESNYGVMMVEWLAFISANLHFLENFHARQCFVPTVTQASNMAKLAKQFGYAIPNNTAAVTDVTISNANDVAFTQDVIIPSGTQVLTAGATQQIWETTADLTIPSGASEGTVAVANWATKTDTDTADGSADFSTILTYAPYVEDTIAVEVDSVGWVAVDNFLDSGSTDEHFRIEVDSDGIVTVIFGDGTNGKVPTAGSSIVYTYKVGGGTDGNVPPDTITVIEGVFYDVTNNPVDLEVTNDDAADGGEDREDISVTRLRLPASIPAREATINYSDFEANITAVSGVARVKVQTVNDDDNIPENVAIIAVLPTSSDTLSDALEAQIEAALEENPTTLTLTTMFTDPELYEILVTIRDLTLLSGYDDSSGTYASATITIASNSFSTGDKVTVNGVDLVETTGFTIGATADDTATNIAQLINDSRTGGTEELVDIEASAVDNVVTVTARTTGEHGNAYTLASTDTSTTNFTLSGSTFTGGADSTIQAEIREQIETFFGRTNVDVNNQYTVGFGQSVFRNKIIWLIEEVEGVENFYLADPSVEETELEANQFPYVTIRFTTSVS